MRVLHIITGLAAGGAEQQLQLLLRHQSAQAEVAALTNPGTLADALRADGVTVHHLGMVANTDLFVLPRLKRLIQARGVDVVHTHLYRASVYGRIAARLAGVRTVVATEHSLGDGRIEGRRISPAVRRVYLTTERLGRTTIAVSTAVARRLMSWGVPASRIDVVPNGIDMDRYRFDPAERERVRHRLGYGPTQFVVGSVGRLVRAKRIDLMIRALHGQPRRAQGRISGLVVGDGPERAPLTALARRLGVDVTFTGETGEVPALLSAMDLYVAPSSEETFGISGLEALAAGLPVGYVDCPALDDLPSPVPQAQRVAADAEAIGEAIVAAAADRAARMRPPSVLARYDIADVAGRIEAIYERVLAGPTGSTPNSEEA